MFDLADGDGPAGLLESPGPERRRVDRQGLVGVGHQRIRHQFARAVGFFGQGHLHFGDTFGSLLAKPLLSVGCLSAILGRRRGGFRRRLLLLTVGARRSCHSRDKSQQHKTRYHQSHSMEAHGSTPRRRMMAAASSIIDGMSGEASPVRNFEFGMKRVEDERWKLENKALRATGGANLSRWVGTAASSGGHRGKSSPRETTT